MEIHFSDFFDVAPELMEEYGALDLSLLNDLPLFVDPFLLFSSDKPEYQSLHEDILRYMRFLRDIAAAGEIDPPLLRTWFTFSEVKQNWLGFSRSGNKGHGLGLDFARTLHRNLHTVFRDFGEEEVTRSSHLEKLCLIKEGVGRDNISDFTTNLIKSFLAEYTQTFAQQHIVPEKRREFSVQKARFDYGTRRWTPTTYELPSHDGDFVLLTPKDILTKDESWINRPELIERFREIADSLPDALLRAQINEYLLRRLPGDSEPTAEERNDAVSGAIERFPSVLDYYIQQKEREEGRARSVASERVADVEARFIEGVRTLVRDFLEPHGFYDLSTDTYDDARSRLLFLKDVIENKGGHKIFYRRGRPFTRESDLHILYRLSWFATRSDVSREVDDGRGPADFKVSRGAQDKTLVEFKLASNTQLERNLKKQAEIYEKASDATEPSLKAIIYFDERQQERVREILRRTGLSGSPHVVLIDARIDNKPSGSKA